MARLVGISLVEYDEMTPAELSVCAEVYGEQQKVEYEQSLFFAHVNAYWQRVDSLKPFNEIMEEGKARQEREEKKMSDMEMLVNVTQLNALFGGNVE